MKNTKVTTTIDRRDGRRTVFTEQFRAGVSIAEQLRREREKLFPKKEGAK